MPLVLLLPSKIMLGDEGDWTEIGIKVSSWGEGGELERVMACAEVLFQWQMLTFFPTIIVLPSADQDKVKASPPTSRRLTHVLERTSQKRTVPSVEQLASSASRTGLKRTFSMPAECPRSSVEYRTAGRSGFQIRSVRSAEPVAISWPAGFHASVRMLLQKSSVSTYNQSKDIKRAHVCDPGPLAAGSL